MMKIFNHSLSYIRSSGLNIFKASGVFRKSINNNCNFNNNFSQLICNHFSTSNSSGNKADDEKQDTNSNDSSSNHCQKEQCGCHSSSSSSGSNTQQDSIEQDLQAKNYEIIECINNGKYDEALDLSDDFINTIKTNFGEDHPFYCSALNNKAFILKTCGQFEEAKTLFTEVTDKYKRIYGDNNEKVIITMHNLATLFKDMKEFEKSLEIYEKILKIIEKENIEIEGEKTGKLRLNIVANIYNSAGGLYRQLKNFSEGDRLFQLAFNIIKENFGENTLPIATVLNNMGLSLKDQGKFSEALQKLEKSLEIRKNLLNADHPEISFVLNNIEQVNSEMNLINNNFNNKI